MEYFFPFHFGTEQRAPITQWVKDRLTKINGDCDDVFLEYVMVMVANGKTVRFYSKFMCNKCDLNHTIYKMGQIATELVAFVGESASSDFATRYVRKLISVRI